MNYEEVDIARVRANPANIRESLGDLTRLTAEIKTMGVQQPLKVYPHPTLAGDFLIQDGHRRRQAAVNAGKTALPVFIVDPPARGELDDVETMLTTGRNHQALTKLEEARGFQRLLDLGLNESTIGKKFKKPKSEIVTKARVASSTESVKSLYGRGRFDLEDVKRLQDLEDAGQTGVFAEVLGKIDEAVDLNRGVNLENLIARATDEQVLTAVREELTALGGVEAPEEAYYSNQYDRVDHRDAPDDGGFTVEAHIAAGHLFYVTYSNPAPKWYTKLTVAKPSLSDLEKEEKQAQRKLSAGLSAAFQVRRRFIVEQIRTKDGGTGEAVDKAMLFKALWYDISKLDAVTLGDIVGFHRPDDATDYTQEGREWMDKVKTAMSKLSWRQIARAAAYSADQDTDKQLRFPKNFDRTSYDWTNRRRWLHEAQTDFGYQLDPAELEALQHFADKGGSYHTSNIPEGETRNPAEDVVIFGQTDIDL